MTADDWDAYIRSLPSVTTSKNYGYRFYFVGDDQRMPFATIADADNEHEKISALHRPGVFRLNIGVRRETFAQLFPQDGGRAGQSGAADYTALDVFMPHPDYAKQSFLCILNPTSANTERTRALIAEAHGIAAKRHGPG
jgi:hypothetical protein